MSAADLFRDSEDVRFRLQDTYLVIGRTLAHVAVVHNLSQMIAGKSILDLTLSGAGHRSVLLQHLPLSAMYNCPSGYVGNYWLSRGPCRQRYQGLVPGSLWGVNKYGDIIHGGIEGLGRDLKNLLSQPSKRKKALRKGVPATNEIMVDLESHVLYKGNYVGAYEGKAEMTLHVEPTEGLLTSLDNAAIRVKG